MMMAGSLSNSCSISGGGEGANEEEGGCSTPEGGATKAAEDVWQVNTHQMGWRRTETPTHQT